MQLERDASQPARFHPGEIRPERQQSRAGQKTYPPAHHRFFDDAKARLAKIDPSGPLPDRYVQSNYEAMNALKLGMEKSKFQGRADTEKLIAAMEGLEMKEGDDFPQGDKTLRKEDHQAFLRQFIFEMKGGTYKVHETIPWQKTVVPPACSFTA